MATKRKAESYDKSDPFIASDDETTSKTRPSKKVKNGKPAQNSSPKAEMQEDDEGNKYWELSSARRVTISDFKGKQMVSIREYYEKDGKQLPGKKGISMTIDQYKTFLSLLPEIEEVLTASGESIPRPNYGGGPVTKADDNDSNDDDDDDSEDNNSSRKANFEATSDEDED